MDQSSTTTSFSTSPESCKIKHLHRVIEGGMRSDCNNQEDCIPLLLLASNMHYTVPACLITHSADQDISDSDRCTALLQASNNKQSDLVKHLVAHAADPYAPDRYNPQSGDVCLGWQLWRRGSEDRDSGISAH